MEPEKTRITIAMIVIFTFIGLMAVLIVRPLTLDEKMFGLFAGLVGVLTGSFKDTIAYFFNSSAGSKTAQAALADIAKGGTGNGKEKQTVAEKPHDPVVGS